MADAPTEAARPTRYWVALLVAFSALAILLPAALGFAGIVLAEPAGCGGG